MADDRLMALLLLSQRIERELQDALRTPDVAERDCFLTAFRNVRSGCRSLERLLALRTLRTRRQLDTATEA